MTSDITKGYPARRAGYPTRTLVLTAVVVLLLAGCHADKGQPVPAAPTDPAVLVLRVHQSPGLAGPADRPTVPGFSLYGGGRVIVSAGYDGALPILHEYRLTPSAYQRLYRQAHTAGLNRSRRIDQPTAADAPTLTITLLSGGTLHTTTVTMPESHDADRDRITGFRRHLAPARWAAADITTGPVDYHPTQLAVIATWSAPAVNAPQARPWPLGSIGTGTPVAGGTCATYQDDQLAQATRLARGATRTTRWTAAGNAYYTVFRPVLPDESGCDALTP